MSTAESKKLHDLNQYLETFEQISPCPFFLSKNGCLNSYQQDKLSKKRVLFFALLQVLMILLYDNENTARMAL